MYDGIVAAERKLKPRSLRRVEWKTDSILPAPTSSPSIKDLSAAIGRRDAPLIDRLLPAFRLGWLRRVERGLPLVLSRLRLNGISILHLPGEMFIEYQLRARAMRPRQAVAVAAYGDDGLWYVPTKDEYPAGGYEVSVAFCDDGIDELITGSIRRLLE
jgi:hypothetical protein